MNPRPVFVLASTEDPASANIVRELKELLPFEDVPGPARPPRELPPLSPKVELLPGWERARLPTGREAWLFTITGLHVHAEGIGEHLAALTGTEPEAVVVASRHRAASARPSLTVHPVGNFGAAEHGGEPGRLTPTHPPLLTAMLRNLARRAAQFRRLEGYAVTFEATHHGPLTSVPLLYAEVGSGPDEWEVPEGGRAVALALMDSLLRDLPAGPVVFGVGGGHYAPRFTNLALEHHCLVGHMLPAHHWEDHGGMERCLGLLVGALPRGAGLTLDRKALKGAEVRLAEEMANRFGKRVWRSGDLSPRGRRTEP